MSRLNEREIARKLAERDELGIPAGLLEKIKSEIPPTIPVGVPEAERRSPMPSRQRWLIAASLIVMIGAGLLALQVRMRVPAVQEATRAEPAPRKTDRLQAIPPTPARPLPAPRVSPPQETRQFLRAEPAAPPPSLKSELQPLKSLGSIGPGEAVEEKGRGGVVGGAAGSARPPAAPAAAPPPAAVQTPAGQAAGQEADQMTATTESPLLDERRVATGATVSQSELEKIPTARDPWAVLQKTPGVMTDRVNVGGNESGQQSQYVGPDAANRPQPSPAAPARAKTAGADPVWAAVSPQPIVFETDAGTASDAAARRSLAAGKLPDPAAIRTGEIVNAFETGDAPAVEGAPTPFVHGPQYRLLRIHPSGVSRMQVSFNPAEVVRYRSIGSGVSALYEIELRRRSGGPGDALVAVLHLGNQGKTVVLSDLAPSWDKASPGFRLTALAAELAEILKGGRGDLSEVARLAREAGKDLPKSAKALELAELAERAARLGERQ